MEQIIFLSSDEESWRQILRLVRGSTRQLVFVLPEHLERLRLSVLLRLIRQAIGGESSQISIISGDRPARLLAEQLGYAVAETLDEYRGLEPGHTPTFQRRARRPAARRPLSLPPHSGGAPLADTLAPLLETPAAQHRRAAPPTETDRSDDPAPLPPHTASSVALASIGQSDMPPIPFERLLQGDFLPNPATFPSLEEETQAEEQEAEERRSRLSYEIADRQNLSQAQQEAEEYEARITATIRQTSAPAMSQPEAASAPPKDTLAPTQQVPEAGPEPPDAGPPEPPAPLPTSYSPQADTPEPAGPLGNHATSWLRPMHTIDDLLHARGRTGVFDWLDPRQHNNSVALPEAAIPQGSTGAGPGGLTSPGRSTVATTARPFSRLLSISAWSARFRRGGQAPDPSAASAKQTPTHSRQASARDHLGNVPFPPPTFNLQHLWARYQRLLLSIGVVVALVSCLAMTGLGLAILPSALVSYQVHLIPAGETLDLEAREVTPRLNAGAPPASPAPAVPVIQAEIARFDGVLSASAPASGRGSPPGSPYPNAAFPTQADVDRTAASLQQPLAALGQSVLTAQASQGDLLGPPVSQITIAAFPNVGAPLPNGITSFHVSVALHLRAVLVRQAALLQTARTIWLHDVGQREPGLTLALQHPLHLMILSSRIANAADGTLALRLQVQVNGLLGPTLTAAQARSAIAGMTVEAAQRYFRSQRGISAVMIHLSPEWWNRLPIFSARITINIESEDTYAADWA